jgi:hypothetical protein
MTHPMAIFLVAAGFTSAICYLLITRAQNRRAQGMLVSRASRGASRAASGDSSAATATRTAQATPPIAAARLTAVTVEAAETAVVAMAAEAVAKAQPALGCGVGAGSREENASEQKPLILSDF